MRNLLSILAIVLCFTINAQTKVGIGVGVLEQSNRLGLGVASTISVHQDIVSNFGITALYNYSVVRDTDFQELSLRIYYREELGRLSLKPNAGIARQVSGHEYLTFGLDMLFSVSDRTQVVLGWQPTARGSFHDPDTGWSLATTTGILIKI